MHIFKTHRFKTYQLSNTLQYRLHTQPHDMYSHVIIVPYIQPLIIISLIFNCAVRNNSGSLHYDRRKVHITVFQSPSVHNKLVGTAVSWLRLCTGNVLLLQRKLTSSIHNRIKSPPGRVTSYLFLS